ncbi:hypothetical protein [Wolbachia endosymbiont of Oedothorax gibbosus]|nr:hypothetical protein [Wolbachia endosymbiont of Oedothorax gibbosus]
MVETDLSQRSGEKVRDVFAKKTIPIKRSLFYSEYKTIINFPFIPK